MTKVIFRRYPNGEVIALFPELPWSDDPTVCASYMHGGQHGPAHLRLGLPLASPAAYGPLAAELTAMGYRLRIMRRAHISDWCKRMAAIRCGRVEGSA